MKNKSLRLLSNLKKELLQSKLNTALTHGVLGLAFVTLIGGPLGLTDAVAAGEKSSSRFSDEPIEPTIDEVPKRPRPLLELGDPFLESGEISEGITLPTGAVWRPQLLMFGTVRSALQHFDPGPGMRDEWVNRADVFANLQLSPTERIIIGSRMLDKNGRFSGYRLNPDSSQGWIDEVNLNITTFYFEGDIGQMFPGLDPTDELALDYGFVFGRQPLLLQDGLLVNDNKIDSVGLVRNNLFIPGFTQARLTGFWGWNDVNRGNNVEDDGADMYALLFEADTVSATYQAEVVYIDSDRLASGLYFGLSGSGRIGAVNTTLTGVYSNVRGDNTPEAADGTLLLAQLNYTPHGSHNFVYGSGFVGIDRFTSASRAPGTGNALGRAGILFAGVGIGGFGAALSNNGADAWGGAVGYQMFFNTFRSQLILEAGTRSEWRGPESSAWAVGTQYQQAFGQRWRLRGSAFIGERETTGGMNGISFELLYQL